MNRHDHITSATMYDLVLAMERHRNAYAAVSRHYTEEADREETAALDALLAMPAVTLPAIRIKAAYLADLPHITDNIIDGHDWRAFLMSLQLERAA